MIFRMLVVAYRHDGSSISSGPLHVAEALALLHRLLDLPTRPRMVIVMRDLGTHVDIGPVLMLEDALRWRQPDDEITRIMKEHGGRN
jgi:hypothetical protein